MACGIQSRKIRQGGDAGGTDDATDVYPDRDLDYRADRVAAAIVWVAAQLGWDALLAMLHTFTGWMLGRLRAFSGGLGTALFWIALAGLGWFAYRTARGQIREDLDSEFATQNRRWSNSGVKTA